MFSCVLGSLCAFLSLFPFSDTPPTEIYTLSLHDALPISAISPFAGAGTGAGGEIRDEGAVGRGSKPKAGLTGLDRKSTRLNSSHVAISYAVFCLKKKKQIHNVHHYHEH